MPLINDPQSRSQTDLNEERRRIHHEGDIVIVGAGIAGCALAVALGNQGRSVILLERDLREPDRIVGELLQPGGVRALEKLGIRGTPVGLKTPLRDSRKAIALLRFIDLELILSVKRLS